MRLLTARQTYEKKPFLKVAVMGQSGAGKTHFAARSPRPLILLTEVQALPSIMMANPEAIVLPITRWNDFREAFNAIKMGRPTTITVNGEEQPALEVTLGGDTVAVQTLVLDTMTDLQRLAFDSMIKADGPNGMDRFDFQTASLNLSIDKHGVLHSAAEEIWRQQRALQINTVFLFLTRDVQDDAGIKQTLPMLTGSKLPYSMGQYFNASGLAQVRRSDGGSLQHLIRWSTPSAAAITKPGPGWPNVTVNSATPGETSLGSLLLFTFPDLSVAHEPHDSAEFVSRAVVAPASSASAAAPQAAAHAAAPVAQAAPTSTIIAGSSSNITRRRR
jgi:hypothetical protein